MDPREELRINTGICGRMQPDGTVPGPTRCQPGGDDKRLTRQKIIPTVVIPRPEDITWEEVRSETKNVVFPGLSVKVQPKGKTLVNMATIVYTDDSKVSTTTVTLLGFPVVVEATPVSYTWDFGDGSPAVTTSTPGRPYPSADITHKYRKRQGVGITVTTNYAARFNVADTGWQYIEGTVPITGPTTLLQVREAVPVLVDPGR
ncbi:PKD domain-containing protein [Kribbella sp. GL6]|uniref:PKD domain-containing protein n=1 Tax=Kribbella sp. GL6 TaxID=3419765 RepID=UPI003D052073